VAANIFCISGRVPVERLFSENVIFELKALSGDTKKFFINWFLNYLTEYWDARESRKEQLNHVVMIDEAHHILMKRTLEGSEPVTDSMFREVRKHGVGLVYLDQSPFRISETVLGNTNTTMVMNLKSQDISVASKAVSLEYQKSQFITWLKEGEAIVRLQFRHPHPFLVKLRLIDIDKAAVTDADLEARQKGMATKDSDIDIHKAFDEGIKQLSVSGGREEEKLSEPEALLLLNVADRPLLGRMERYAELGLAHKEGRKAIDSLMEQGLLAENWIRGEKAPHGDVLRITDEGWQAMKEQGLVSKSRKANESAQHDFTILKNLEVGFDLVVSLPNHKALQEKIRRKVATLIGPEQERVRVMTPKELYSWLPGFKP
jgi:hypothetical protein